MIPKSLVLALLAGALAVPALAQTPSKPLKALLIAGGCCHDYTHQQEVLSKGIQSRANVQVDVIWTDDTSVSPPLPLYDNPDWAKGYDIIIHDECAAGVKDMALVKRILDVHKTVPAVHLHCAMHSFRTGTDAWFKHLGLQSASHGPQEPIAIAFVDKEHPITKTLADWTTIKEELYNNVNVFDAHPLAMGRQIVKNKDGTTREDQSIVAWTNEKSGARSFSTTIGHNTATVEDARYLDLVTRGLLWACDKLTADYLVPFKGENKITFVKAKPVLPKEPAKPAAAAPGPPPAPKDATLVTVTASTEESGKQNFTWKAVDNDENTRWCANSPDYPQWLQLEFEKPQSLTGISTTWENKGVYRYKVEGSADGKAWRTLLDASDNTKAAPYSDDFPAKADGIKFVKINALGKTSGGWASIREVKLKGEGIKLLAPKMSAQQQANAAAAAKVNADPYKTGGNVAPKIVKLTAEQEAAILKDVKVPEGFEVSLFANSAAANYPVYVAAAPDGTLYVSSDGNGSLGRNPKRGRVIRLRDLDGDGRADETKVFCDIDAPRGLVWDRDRLYVVHPPHLSEFVDADHDGVAEKQNILVKNIAFGYDQRPADHTTNGLSLGIDGWLYIAGGDFGFMKAEGTDGKTLQHRGGGVIRLRPDGTGLEIYSTGTRNILEVAISPTMDIFARDNTNDGGGWNVRFHHFTGLDDHGYPRLYKNFNDEAIQPLADYGGGSGCGAVYIDEPGFGVWNNAPFTADWGTGAIWHHEVKPKGVTFEETRKPEPFIKMTRPTDADVDAMGHVYASSWKGATFNWEGPDVGYIVRVTPKGFKAEPLPDFAKLGDVELVKQLESASNRRRMEAQRELVKRAISAGLSGDAQVALNLLIGEMHEAHGFKPSNVPAATKAAVIFATTLSNKGTFGRYVVGHAKDDPEVADIYWRAALDRPVAATGKMDVIEHQSLIDWPQQASARTRMAMTRAFAVGAFSPPYAPSAEDLEAMRKSSSPLPNKADLPWIRNALLDDAVSLQMMAAMRLAILKLDGRENRYVMWDDMLDGGRFNTQDCLWYLFDYDKDTTVKRRILEVFRGVHAPEVVEGLISRLSKATDATLRQGILSALCRLHFHEGEWKGDSWGTRPDTRGPYYQPEPWAETPKIAAALKDALSKATPEEAAFLVKEMNRNRIQSSDALERILALAKQDTKVLPDAVAQLAVAETIPADAVPLLLQALKLPEAKTSTLSQAIIALTKTDSAEGVAATLAALSPLQKMPESQKDYEAATTAFFNSPKLENHHLLVEQAAEKLDGDTSRTADAALLYLASRNSGSPESKELSAKAIEHGWQADPNRRVQIIDAIASVKHQASAPRVLVALDDPDPKVKAAAERPAKTMKLQKVEDKTPKIATLEPAAALEAVVKAKGDVVLGEQIFARATCVACHTTKESEAQKGPYLGNIAQTYKRPELAQNILDPNKTIAQGFASELILTKGGEQQMGFITLEGATEVKLRNIAAQEFTFKTADIKERQKLPMSMMPPGLMMNFTVREFASLLDYLESLSKK
ncbi:MAG: DUF7133 domain-containing protein [Prosthecobacter sp.]